MDENKLKKLNEVGYAVNECCGLCKHGMFAGRSDFGTCAIKTYDHLKHTGSDRQLSINRYGACASGFELSDVAEASLGLWRQFLTTQALNRVYSDE